MSEAHPTQSMIDTLTSKQRSAQMRLIRSTNTGPELVVRKLVHKLGYRFRLHRADLPGRPDIVLPRHQKAILVHGCFWHGHGDPTCKLARLPKSNRKYWLPKIAGNRARDERCEAELVARGWKVLTVWECQARDLNALSYRVAKFLSGKVVTRLDIGLLTFEYYSVQPELEAAWKSTGQLIFFAGAVAYPSALG